MHFEPFAQNASCDSFIAQGVTYTLYPVCHEAFGIACDTGYSLRLDAGSPAIAASPFDNVIRVYIKLSVEN